MSQKEEHATLIEASDEEATVASRDDDVEVASGKALPRQKSAPRASLLSLPNAPKALGGEGCDSLMHISTVQPSKRRRYIMLTLATVILIVAAVSVGLGLHFSGPNYPDAPIPDGSTEEMREYRKSHPYVDPREEEEARRAQIEIEQIQATMEYLETEDADAMLNQDEAAVEQLIESRRALQTDIKYHNSICPSAPYTGNCQSINMALVTASPFVIECGVCMQITEASGAVLDFPGGIHVRGKL